MIDKETIENIAKLARLKVTEDEAKYFGEQLSHVLGHFQQISKIDTTHVEPLITASEIEFFLRDDVARAEISTEAITANAPDRAGKLFKVPPVV